MNKLIALIALTLAAGLTGVAQQPEFKAGVEVVTVPVTVTSLDHNTFIEGLTAADFKLSENGERQVVTTVLHQRRPVSLAIVVDSSGSMGLGIRKDLAIFAVEKVREGLLPDDEIAIVFFGEQKADTRLPWTRVGDIKALNWSGWLPYGSTPLNDGMRLGLTMVAQARHPRRALMLVTDGFENASRESTSSIVKTREQSETIIFGVGVGSANINDLRADLPTHANSFGKDNMARVGSEDLRRLEANTPGASALVRKPEALPYFDYLETLVGDSGGSVLRVLTTPEAAMAAKNITNELQHEYVLGYTPTKPLDGKYRRLKVELNRRGLYLRHRGGYLAIPSVPQ
jgi:Ca-activated chloride channel family protein